MTDSPPPSEIEILWSPSPDVLAKSQIGRWNIWLGETRGLSFNTYREIWQWSVADLEGFWTSIWDYFGVLGDRKAGPVLASLEMPGATWFEGATINWAENALHRLPAGVAVVARSQTRGPSDITGQELSEQVARVRAGLVRLGIRRGDRVAAYLPNIPEALFLLLACASIGAVFSSCPPEFGVKGVVDRFRQIEPALLVTVDGYRHRSRDIDRRSEAEAIRAGIPSVRATVMVPYLDPSAELPGAISWDDLTESSAPLVFERLPFDHPLYILYSSGTTGPPKAVVHGHGGIVLEHVKGHHLHLDLGPGDRFFWYSTTGWVMWNFLVSGLLTGASIVLFDGDPAYPDNQTLWALAAEENVTVFGVSAPFLLTCRKAGLHPGATHDLSRMRALGSTGAPLPKEGFRWVYDEVKDDVFLSSISGGTDICGAFVGGVPILPVTAGEIACRCLGVAVEAFDENGLALIGEQGELVVTAPMPSMPVAFWGDEDGARYRASYFERFPGKWAQGDWITITDRDTCLISGRSDATLDRGGVRLGTSEFYAIVEALPEVTDSLVVHLEDSEGGIGEVVLFVQLGAEKMLDNSLIKCIAGELRTALSPRYVPDTVLEVPLIPRTLSGKKLEIPVKRILQGWDPASVAGRDSLLDPDALDAFVSIASTRRSGLGRTP